MLIESKKEHIKFNKLHNKYLNTEAKIKVLETKFVNLVKSADAYFNEVKKIADSIGDIKLKNSAMNKALEREKS